MTTPSEPHVGDWQDVAPGVWRAVCEPAGVNVGLVAGDDAALLVDTGSSPAHGKAIRDSVVAVTDRPLRHVVITHAHWDHWLGAAAFRDIDLVGHTSLVDGATSGPYLDDAVEHGVAASDVVAPTTALSLIKAVDLGGRRVEIIHGGPAHTRGDVFVFVPDADVVFAGDMLEQSAPPSFGPDADLKNWAPALDVMLGLLNERSVVVPGHGEPMDHMDSFEQRARIGVIYPTVLDLVKQGVQREQALGSGDWPYPPQIMEPALDLAYEAVKKSGIDPRRQLGLRAM